MSGVGDINNVNLEALGLTKAADSTKKTLGQEDFLKLLVAQMNNQDPTQPTENGEFLAQMAQFGTVDGIQSMKHSIESLSASMQSNQALQASTLVGRSVLVPGYQANLSEGKSIRGATELPNSASQVRVSILNQNGELVRQMNLGSQPAGTVSFEWDGKNNSGETAKPGNYLISVQGVFGNQTMELTPMLYANVDSVSIGTGGAGLQLNLAGQGSISLSQVKQISQ